MGNFPLSWWGLSPLQWGKIPIAMGVKQPIYLNALLNVVINRMQSPKSPTTI